MKKIRTRTIDYTLDAPSLTNTGDIHTDYNNIKALKYPEKSDPLKVPPRSVIIKNDTRPKYIQYSSTMPDTFIRTEPSYVFQDIYEEPRVIISEAPNDRSILVKQITFPNGITENINSNTLTKDWKLEPYTVLGSSFA
jgi:hypothetical protein